MKKILFSLMLLSMFSCGTGDQAAKGGTTNPAASPEKRPEKDDAFKGGNPSPEAKKEAKVEFEPVDENWKNIKPDMLVDTSIPNDIYLYFSKDSDAKAQFKIKSDVEQIESVEAVIQPINKDKNYEILQPYNDIYSCGFSGLSGTVYIKVKCKSGLEKIFPYYRLDRKEIEVSSLLQLILNQKREAFFDAPEIYNTDYFTAEHVEKRENLSEYDITQINKRYGGTIANKNAYFFINMLILKLHVFLNNVTNLDQEDLNKSTQLIIRVLGSYLNSFVANDQDEINIKVKSSKIAVKLIEMLLKKGAKLDVLFELSQNVKRDYFILNLDCIETKKMFLEMLNKQEKYYINIEFELGALSKFETDPFPEDSVNMVKLLAEIKDLKTKMLNGVLKE